MLTSAVSPAGVKARLGIDGVLAAVGAGHPNRADPGGRALARINSSTSGVPVGTRSSLSAGRGDHHRIRAKTRCFGLQPQSCARETHDAQGASRLPCISTHLPMPCLQRVLPAPPTHHWEGLTQKATAKVPSGHCA